MEGGKGCLNSSLCPVKKNRKDAVTHVVKKGLFGVLPKLLVQCLLENSHSCRHEEGKGECSNTWKRSTAWKHCLSMAQLKSTSLRTPVIWLAVRERTERRQNSQTWQDGQKTISGPWNRGILFAKLEMPKQS